VIWFNGEFKAWDPSWFESGSVDERDAETSPALSPAGDWWRKKFGRPKSRQSSYRSARVRDRLRQPADCHDPKEHYLHFSGGSSRLLLVSPALIAYTSTSHPSATVLRRIADEGESAAGPDNSLPAEDSCKERCRPRRGSYLRRRVDE
jgi:hypothetical protein